MKAILINYNYTPIWLLESDLDYLIYDRSDSDSWLEGFPKERIIKRKNIGNVDYDKLEFLITNYHTLPNVFLWGKSNIFKYVEPQYLRSSIEEGVFEPLLKFDHKSYHDQFGLVCYYDEEDMYRERNNSWYLNPMPSNHFGSFQEWAKEFNLPCPDYIPFNPGGNFILTKEVVHKYPKEFYEKMRDTMGYTQLPGEAQLAERSYYLLWS